MKTRVYIKNTRVPNISLMKNLTNKIDNTLFFSSLSYPLQILTATSISYLSLPYDSWLIVPSPMKSCSTIRPLIFDRLRCHKGNSPDIRCRSSTPRHAWSNKYPFLQSEIIAIKHDNLLIVCDLVGITINLDSVNEIWIPGITNIRY